MNEAPPTRSFVAAALPLFAFPLAAVAYAVFVSSDHRLDRTIVVVWQDNPVRLSLIAVVGLVACGASSLLSFMGSQRASAASFAVAPLSGLVVITSAILSVRSVRGHLVVLPMISAFDRPQFAIAVTKEGLVVFGAGLTLSAALLIASAVGQLSGRSRASRVGGLVSLAGAIAASLTLARLDALNQALARGLRATPRELLDLVALETSALRVPATPAATLLVLLVVAVGVVALRTEPRHAVMLALLGPAAAFPAAALVLTASSAVSIAKSIVPASSRSQLSALAGVPTAGPQLVLGARGAMDVAGRPLPLSTTFDSLEQYLARAPTTDREPWRVGLEPGARLDDLVSLLQIAKRLEVSRVDLIGSHDVDVASSAAEVRPLLEHLRYSFRAVRLTITNDEYALPVSTSSIEGLHAAALEATEDDRSLRVLVEP